MKKLQTNQILIARSTLGKTTISFYEVLKSTTNTCELHELQKQIVEQSYDEQEVIPMLGKYISKPIRCKVLPTGCAKIDENLHAWPWDGTPQWQSVLIYMP